ncbi:DNA topoisomerase VI subunit B [Candidatus Woesearchaeota archaeon]|nr:DNA topoisomerase VI subunit B [Candidatus Woesearchaeota archaeon]
MADNRVHAKELAKHQREISVAEFFEKNRHLLGFDNPKKALLTTIKEAVDNALDACEEARILPEVNVEVIDMGNSRFRVIVEDNGPGIIRSQIPKIFAKLLYGSKFHRLSQSRGQQGIGISASVMYSQLTTGKAVKIMSKTDSNGEAHYYELKIDTKKNKPEIIVDETRPWENKEHGTRIELDLEAEYKKGSTSIDEYLKETGIINPHVTLIYVNPESKQIIFPRAVEELPKEPKEIKPHPYGVELGALMKMMKFSEYKNLNKFLKNEFSKVGSETVKKICEEALIDPSERLKNIRREEAEKLIQAIKKTKIIAPSTDCLSPIGEEPLEKGLRKGINAEFYCSVSRSPNVYRGNPFQIEVALAYGGELEKEGKAEIMRFANKVPLLYQKSACAITKAVKEVKWRSYRLKQSNNSIPDGPLTIIVHMASVWVPFTSESKEAIAHYPQIIDEIKLALQEAGRKLKVYLSKKQRIGKEIKKRSLIEKYMPHVAEALQDILGLSDTEKKQLIDDLKIVLEKDRGKIDDIEFDKDKNADYSDTWALNKENEEENENKDEDEYNDEEENENKME